MYTRSWCVCVHVCIYILHILATHTHTHTHTHSHTHIGFSGGASGKEPTCQCRRHKKHGLIPGSWRSPGEEMAVHSSFVAWRIPWIDEPGRLQSILLQRIRHDWSNKLTDIDICPSLKYWVFQAWFDFFKRYYYFLGDFICFWGFTLMILSLMMISYRKLQAQWLLDIST